MELPPCVYQFRYLRIFKKVYYCEDAVNQGDPILYQVCNQYMFIIPHASSHGRRIRTFASSDYTSDCLTTWLFRHIKKGEIKKMLFQDYNILNITRKEVNGASTQNRTENRRLQVYRFTFKLQKHKNQSIAGLEPATYNLIGNCFIHLSYTFQHPPLHL